MNGLVNLKNYFRKEKSHWQITKSIKTVKFNHRDQAEWLLLIADLLKSGFSLRHAIEFSGTISKKQVNLFQKINLLMGEGKTFAECLRPYIKPTLYYQLLLAEQHGNLEECLQEVGRVMMLREKQRQKLITLLQYPLILIGLLMALMITLKIFVFPELSQWGTETSGRIGNYVIETGAYFCGASLVMSGFALIRWRKLNQLQKVNVYCSLPIVGKCYRLFYGYYVVTNLAMMIRHGLTLNEICVTLEKDQGEGFLALLGRMVRDEAKLGQDLTKIMRHVSFLPRELAVIAEKGSTLADLGKDLSALTNILFQRLTKRIERLLMLVQPIIFGIVALVIIALYLRLLLPIYHSVQGVI